MLSLTNNQIRYDYSRCQQCGICEAVCPKQAISLKLLDNGTHEVIVDNDKCIRCKRCVACCPANKQEDYKTYFDGIQNKKYFLGYHADNRIRHESSSGGVGKTIIIESLRNGVADGVYSLKRTDVYPFAEGEFYTPKNIPNYEDIPNSVYHSVMACRNINRIQKCKRLLVVGTSCQLRAMNAALKGKAEETISICIFCKQQKTLESTRFLAKMMGTDIPSDLNFSVQYRGKGWPGTVQIREAVLPWHRAAQLPFGRRLWTVAGCNICGDPFGTKALADITLMDPWKIRTPNDLGETLAIVHTEKGRWLLEQLPSLKLESKSFKEVAPALDLKDIWRKQQLVSFFCGEKCDEKITKAGKAEQRQRAFLTSIVKILPRMPMIVYRALCKLPDWRNKALK